MWKRGRFAAADIALLHLNGLVAYAGAYLLIDPVCTTASGPLAAALALLNGAIALLLVKRFRDEALHFAALAFTLLTIAVGLQLEGPWITSAWAAEGAVVVWLGLRERREWLRAGGLLLFVVACAQLVIMQFAQRAAGQVLLLNEWAMCGCFIIALTYGLALVHQHHGAESTRKVEAGVLLLAAKLLVFSLAASEILAYWSLHPAPPFEPEAQLIVAALITGVVIMWLGLRRQQEWLRAVGGAVVSHCGSLTFGDSAADGALCVRVRPERARGRGPLRGAGSVRARGDAPADR